MNNDARLSLNFIGRTGYELHILEDTPTIKMSVKVKKAVGGSDFLD